MTTSKKANTKISIRVQIAGLALLSLGLSSGCGQNGTPGKESIAHLSRGDSIHANQREHHHGLSGSDQFDYYVLSLSWAPTFCANPEHRHARECDPSQEAGFVLHGLWPQREHAKGPEDCNPASPLGEAALKEADTLMPDPVLARHEWRAHGTCSGLSPEQYFETMKQARERVNVPLPYRSPQRGLRTSPRTVEQRFAQASHIEQPGTIRAHCMGNQLAEVRFCFTRNLDPRTCSETVGECRSDQIFMRPVR